MSDPNDDSNGDADTDDDLDGDIHTLRAGPVSHADSDTGSTQTWVAHLQPCHSAVAPCHPYFVCNSLGTLHIHRGDSITWTWDATQVFVHSVTSGTCDASQLSCVANGDWDSGQHSGPFTFTHTFLAEGDFPYFCSAGHLRWRRLFGGSCGPIRFYETGVVHVSRP